MSDTADASYEALEYSDRFFVQNAKGAITGLVQIAEEIASNEDEAISRRAAREKEPDHGKIEFHYDPARMELAVTGDGDGMTANRMQERLGKVGDVPQNGSKRSYFHRGVRDVFLAMGSGEVTSIGLNEAGEHVLSRARFEAGKGMAIVERDRAVTDEDRKTLGIARTGTVVTVPVKRFAQKKPRQFEFAQIESQIRNCVGLRAVLTDSERDVSLRFGDEPPREIRFEYPTGDDLVIEQEFDVAGHRATFWAKVAEKPFNARASIRTRQNGILVRSERACYEVVAGTSLKNHPAMSRVFGELRIDEIEAIQRAADHQSDDDTELIYQPDRSGLNKENLIVQEVLDFVDELLGPLIADLDSNQSKKPVTSDVRRQLQRLAREINKVVQENEVRDVDNPEGGRSDESTPNDNPQIPPEPAPKEPREMIEPIEFAYDRIFLPAGAKRTVKIYFDTRRLPAGEQIRVVSPTNDLVRGASLSADVVPQPSEDGDVTEVSVTFVGGDTEGRHEFIVESADHSAELPIHVRFPRASGFITQIVPDERDWEAGSALWDPSTGVVNVFVGRPEFLSAARDAKQAGVEEMKHPEYRQLVVESVREAALWSAAVRIAEVEWDDLTQTERDDPHNFQELVRIEFQALDYQLRAKLLRVFADAS